jgi:hypothetical protein
MQHASGCVAGCVRELVALVEQAGELGDVAARLSEARACFLSPLLDRSDPDAAAPAGASAWRWSALADAARATSWAALATLFCWRELQAIVDALLSGEDRARRAPRAGGPHR